MFSIQNTSTFYVSQSTGNDSANGFAPTADNHGNAPFKSVDKAINVIKALRAGGLERPMTISIVGDYYISSPIVIKDVSRVTIESFRGEGRVIGGIKVDGWKSDNFNGADCLCAELPLRENGGKWDFTDLFVNGKRALVTRFPKEGKLKIIDTEEFVERPYPPFHDLIEGSYWFIVDPKDLEPVENILDATINYDYWWIDGHSPIESYDKESGKLKMKYRTRFTASALYGLAGSAVDYYLTGVPNMFGSAGEWYLDRNAGKVYYIPLDESETADTIEVFAPVSDKLFIIEGEDVRIRNLELTCTRGDYASVGLSGKQIEMFEGKGVQFGSDIQSVCWAPGAIRFERANRCAISNCRIHGVGVHGVEISKACKHIRVEENEIYDLCAGGVKIEGGTAAEDRSLATTDCHIRENHIHHCGRRYAAGCGVLVMHSSDNEVSENEIHDLSYTGISVGWVWGYKESTTFGNVIRRNHIYNVGNGSLSDMGGIYLLGKQNGTVVSENRIHDIKCNFYGAWGIYPDEGSSNLTIENNAVYNTGKESFHFHYGKDNVVRNNVFYSENFSAIILAVKEDHNQVVFERNLMVTDGSRMFGQDRSDMTRYNLSRNIICDRKNADPVISHDESGRAFNLSEWEALFDYDSCNVVADHGMEGIENYDFTLSEESAAREIGFDPLHERVAKKK